MSPLAFKQSLQSECGQKKRGCPIRLCPRGSQKKNLMDSRVFQGQELSCHWCWGPRTPATCPWRKGQSLERWCVQVCGHFLSRPFVLGNSGLCPHLRQSWGCAHVGVWAHAGGPARLIWTRGSPLPLLARLLSLSACVFLKGDLSLAAERLRPSFRSVLAFDGLVTSPRFHCFKTASRVGAWGCHLLALGRYFHFHFWFLFIQRPSGTHSAIFLESPPAASHN